MKQSKPASNPFVEIQRPCGHTTFANLAVISREQVLASPCVNCQVEAFRAAGVR